MEERADLGRHSPPKKLTSNGIFSLSMLFRPTGPAEVKHVPIFVRDDLAPLYKKFKEFLKTPKLVKFHLTGAPGTGKTSFVMLMCRMWVSRKPEKKVIFISYRSQKPTDIFIFQGAKVHWYAGGVESKDVSSVVKQIVENEGNFSLCVFDGVRDPEKDTDCKSILQVVNGYTGTNGQFRRTVTITSMSFRYRDTDDISGEVFDSLDSWKWETHVKCFNALLSENIIPDLLVEDILAFATEEEEGTDDGDTEMVDTAESGDDFSEMGDTDSEASVKVEEAQIDPDLLLRYFEEKYFYAGGSARYMYNRTTSALKLELERLMDGVTNWEPFTTTDIPSSEVLAALMQQFKSNGKRMATPVSKCVLMRAYGKCESLMLSAVRDIAELTGNPSLQGWAFELEELEKIKEVLKTPPEHPRHLRTKEQLVLYPKSEATFDGSTLRMPSDYNGGLVVIWCLKWNQGCFDVALFLDGRLVTLQFTKAATHSLKIQFISQLRSALIPHDLQEAAEVFHWFVVQDDDVLNAFKHKTPTGTGRTSCKLEFTVSVCKSTGFEVAEGTAVNILTSQDKKDIRVHSNKRMKEEGAA